jgi:hypothetical protein
MNYECRENSYWKLVKASFEAYRQFIYFFLGMGRFLLDSFIVDQNLGPLFVALAS